MTMQRQHKKSIFPIIEAAENEKRRKD